MKNKYEPSKRKPIREVTTRKDHSGESSPYWDWLGQSQRPTDEGLPAEDTLANPDVLSEDANLYNKPLSEDGQIRLRAVEKAMAMLSARQREVIQLHAIDGLTLEQTAEKLQIKVGSVQQFLKRAKEKIRKVYEKEKLVS